MMVWETNNGKLAGVDKFCSTTRALPNASGVVTRARSGCVALPLKKPVVIARAVTPPGRADHRDAVIEGEVPGAGTRVEEELDRVVARIQDGDIGLAVDVEVGHDHGGGGVQVGQGDRERDWPPTRGPG